MGREEENKRKTAWAGCKNSEYEMKNGWRTIENNHTA